MVDEQTGRAPPVSSRVTAIVPTLADRGRRETLVRALKSLKRASADPVRILVVVNGNRFDPEVIALVRAMPDVLVHQVKRGSLPYAIEVGRSLVSTPFFCFLDDDDEYLPNAIDLRLSVLDADASLDLVVTNGYRCSGSADSTALGTLGAVSRDPLRALFDGNWLASCGALFRSGTVGPDVFRDVNAYTEWTWIAFQLARGRLRIAVLDKPTFRIYETAGSASKSDAYRHAFLGLYRRMLAAGLPRDLRRSVRWRMCDARHDLSEIEWQRGNLGAAWRFHLSSLLSARGLRYLPYTRRLLSTWRSRSA